MSTRDDEIVQVNLRMWRSERDAVREITKVNAAATGIMAIVRQRIADEQRKKEGAGHERD